MLAAVLPPFTSVSGAASVAVPDTYFTETFSGSYPSDPDPGNSNTYNGDENWTVVWNNGFEMTHGLDSGWKVDMTTLSDSGGGPRLEHSMPGTAFTLEADMEFSRVDFECQPSGSGSPFKLFVVNPGNIIFGITHWSNDPWQTSSPANEELRYMFFTPTDDWVPFNQGWVVASYPIAPSGEHTIKWVVESGRMRLYQDGTLVLDTDGGDLTMPSLASLTTVLVAPQASGNTEDAFSQSQSMWYRELRLWDEVYLG